MDPDGMLALLILQCFVPFIPVLNERNVAGYSQLPGIDRTQAYGAVTHDTGTPLHVRPGPAPFPAYGFQPIGLQPHETQLTRFCWMMNCGADVAQQLAARGGSLAALGHTILQGTLLTEQEAYHDRPWVCGLAFNSTRWLLRPLLGINNHTDPHRLNGASRYKRNGTQVSRLGQLSLAKQLFGALYVLQTAGVRGIAISPDAVRVDAHGGNPELPVEVLSNTRDGHVTIGPEAFVRAWHDALEHVLGHPEPRQLCSDALISLKEMHCVAWTLLACVSAEFRWAEVHTCLMLNDWNVYLARTQALLGDTCMALRTLHEIDPREHRVVMPGPELLVIACCAHIIAAPDDTVAGTAGFYFDLFQHAEDLLAQGRFQEYRMLPEQLGWLTQSAPSPDGLSPLMYNYLIGWEWQVGPHYFAAQEPEPCAGPLAVAQRPMRACAGSQSSRARKAPLAICAAPPAPEHADPAQDGDAHSSAAEVLDGACGRVQDGSGDRDCTADAALDRPLVAAASGSKSEDTTDDDSDSGSAGADGGEPKVAGEHPAAGHLSGGWLPPRNEAAGCQEGGGPAKEKMVEPGASIRSPRISSQCVPECVPEGVEYGRGAAAAAAAKQPRPVIVLDGELHCATAMAGAGEEATQQRAQWRGMWPGVRRVAQVALCVSLVAGVVYKVRRSCA